MTVADPQIYLERIEPNRNMARFYALEIEADLFGHVLAVRRWGRIGTMGRRQSLPCPSRDLAVAEVERLRDVKLRRGYRQVLAFEMAAALHSREKCRSLPLVPVCI